MLHATPRTSDLEKPFGFHAPHRQLAREDFASFAVDGQRVALPYRSPAEHALAQALIDNERSTANEAYSPELACYNGCMRCACALRCHERRGVGEGLNVGGFCRLAQENDRLLLCFVQAHPLGVEYRDTPVLAETAVASA